MKKEPEKQTAYIALGELALALRGNITPYLETIMSMVKTGLVKQRNAPLKEAMQCLSMLALAEKTALNPYMDDVLNLMFDNGLSQDLTNSLTEIAQHLPTHLPEIQERLLQLLSSILVNKPYYHPGTPEGFKKRTNAKFLSASAGFFLDAPDASKIILALSVLGNFDFSSISLLEFVNEAVVMYLDDLDPNIRVKAASTCAKLIVPNGKMPPERGHAATLINTILQKLLMVGITDTDAQVRLQVLTALDARYYRFLSQADNLRCLFFALNDEVFEIRELAIINLGQMAELNPAYVLPSLRKTLLQLLTELKFTGDNRNKEESARLLSLLLSSSQNLVEPYVEPILTTLHPKLSDANPRVVTCALDALGELTKVGQTDITEQLPIFLPLIIDTLQDQSSTSKREVALRTLRHLVAYSGCVIDPFVQYPTLLELLLHIIKTDQVPTVRQEAIRVLGTIGALDPFVHKMKQLQRKDLQDMGALTAPDPEQSGSVIPVSEVSMSPSADEYYPTVAIHSLTKILRDPSLSAHHTQVVQAVVGNIFKSLGPKCIPYLNQFMPPFKIVINTCEPPLRKFMFQQLGTLVTLTKQHIREYLPDIIQIIHTNWESAEMPQLISLVGDIAFALKDEFKPYLKDLLPQIVNVLYIELRTDLVQRVMNTLHVFGSLIDEYLHLVIPAVVRMFEHPEVHKSVKIISMSTMAKLCAKVSFGDYASRIIHPLVRVLAHLPARGDEDLQHAVMDALCVVACELNQDFRIFIPLIQNVIRRKDIRHRQYETVTKNILSYQPPLPEKTENSSTVAETESMEASVGAKLRVNENNLRRAWKVENKTTREDWFQWLRRFAVELLRESPSPALRSCKSLAQVYPSLANQLFNAGFYSCWAVLSDESQDQLITAVETALDSTTIPPEILQALLNLAEFMERDDKPLPIDMVKLGDLAMRCRAYAKALRYKEAQFRTDPNGAIASLISIYNELQQPEGANGVIAYSRTHHNMQLEVEWYEKLGRWNDGLQAYEKRLSENDNDYEALSGRIRCLTALGEWSMVASTARGVFSSRRATEELLRSIAPVWARAAWNLDDFDAIAAICRRLPPLDAEGEFYHAVLAVHNENYSQAQKHIDKAREATDAQIRVLASESYSRAYDVVVDITQQRQLEEVMEYRQLNDKSCGRAATLRKIWKDRLEGVQPNVEVWSKLISVVSLATEPGDEPEPWLDYASLCRRNGRMSLSRNILMRLMNGDPARALPDDSISPSIRYAYLKHLRATGDIDKALSELYNLVDRLSKSPDSNPQLLARAYVKLGRGSHSRMSDTGEFDIKQMREILNSFQAATEFDPDWHVAWHEWAYTNFEIVHEYEREGRDFEEYVQHILPAIYGFFRAIALQPSDMAGDQLQDTLRILSLWFNHGAHGRVQSALCEGFNSVSIDTWLEVIPQIIARIHAPVKAVRSLIHGLLHKVGQAHPQALVYPLTVAAKSQSATRRNCALLLLDALRQHSSELVDQAQLVSDELIRVAILWHELWHEGLEEASRQCFGDHNIEGMLATLEPLHAMLEKGPETVQEKAFQQAFGRDLTEARSWCQKYQRTRKDTDLNHAWELYYHAFRRIYKQLPQLTSLDLEHVSPKLLNVSDLVLSVPGTYKAGDEIITIQSFAQTMSIISSKQRPRKLTMYGSDGNAYLFLLKGHEDIRQDERVMQLFGLVNILLSADRETAQKHFHIPRYSVCPLSPNSGLLGWVPYHDTLHSLIREHRDSKKIVLNIEHRLMVQFCSDYENLPLINRVEVFDHALKSTNGMDLDRILWLKSETSEAWLECRTNYTESLAVMSMVGYILGLGDRHPSNLMLNRFTGRVLHIDFGDCFEVAMHREKFPEKIPFRLTRMLVNAMDVSGIEGCFRHTCESVMHVARRNKESLMAVLEAFVYDPLLNWRLLTPNSPDTAQTSLHRDELDNTRRRKNTNPIMLQTPVREELNERAVEVIDRVSSKLHGRDFGDHVVDVKTQVQLLIEQATMPENLCQCYIGWCAFW